jgi:dihydrofolate synthase/folylpolyglutamate synthase
MLDCDHPNKAVEKRLESIYALHNKKMDFRLDKGPYRDLLTNLRNPQNNMPSTIHVAGTNGKGSTIAFLGSLLEAAGLTVHIYASPHLIKFNERIILGGQQITDDQLIHYMDVIDDANNGNPLTFFEYTTTLAFKAFADTPADICLLETGLGGRLDCTNVIENPIATIITPIGYDHMDWLGADINAIAGEKAGIMKAGAPCFIAPQPHDVMDVFKVKSKETDCDLHFVDRMDDLPALGLVGDHQKDNASVALSVLSSLGLTQGSQNTALQNTKWPARMEKMNDNPEIWFDCGHNVDGAKTIATQLDKWKTDNPTRPIHLVLGLANDKDPNEFLSLLVPYINSITCVDLMNARNPQSAKDLASKITVFDDVKIKKDIQCAIHNDQNAINLITGSLYLYQNLKFDI